MCVRPYSPAPPSFHRPTLILLKRSGGRGAPRCLGPRWPVGTQPLCSHGKTNKSEPISVIAGVPPPPLLNEARSQRRIPALPLSALPAIPVTTDAIWVPRCPKPDSKEFNPMFSPNVGCSVKAMDLFYYHYFVI